MLIGEVAKQAIGVAAFCLNVVQGVWNQRTNVNTVLVKVKAR
jgi:hypothetical protein